jgi:hypothetical protein
VSQISAFLPLSTDDGCQIRAFMTKNDQPSLEFLLVGYGLLIFSEFENPLRGIFLPQKQKWLNLLPPPQPAQKTKKYHSKNIEVIS